VALQVVNGAKLTCSFGTAPSNLLVLPLKRNVIVNQQRASVQDFMPMTNIMPFGLCISPSNPQVAAATAAAMGVLTPQPCLPATSAPWTPGAPTVELANQIALDSQSMCQCLWAGVITITDPGQEKTDVP
jgi:hypothetical protein